MKITDMIISAIIKRGILHEARNVDMEFEVPITTESESGGIKQDKVVIKFKAEHMTLRIEKEDK